MLATAFLVFREVLEAALIVSVVLAATRALQNRRWIVLRGLGAGIAAAIVVAVFAGQIAAFAGGQGQELFNAGVLLAAAAMIGWHVMWMAQHGRAFAGRVRAISDDISTGSRTFGALTILVALAVAREGSEIVLFLHGMAAGGIEAAPLFAGAAIGLAGGVVMGALLYAGLLRISMRRFFAVTNAALILLAAGLAAQAAKFLVQADLLPTLGGMLWDSSWLLTERSLPGQVLHVLIGYTARPNGMQLIFYFATLLTLGLGAYLCRPRRNIAGTAA